MLLYHHCRDLRSVVYGEVKPNPKYSDPFYRDACLWLEKEVGFYPLFLAVGVTDEDLRMTGYQNQWRKILSESPKGKEYRKKGDFPNDVLFSFEKVDGIFMDYDHWHLVLNAGYKQYNMNEYERRLVFKPSWPASQWIRKAKKNQHTVQLVTRQLYLPDAQRILVRNEKTKKTLRLMDFENIEAKRLLLEESEYD